MKSDTPFTPPNSRLLETIPGKIITGLLCVFVLSLFTTATGGEWYALFVPACVLCLIAGLFIYCLIRGYKMPSLGGLGWLALSLGAGYFGLAAWFSSWFYYEGLSDFCLVLTGILLFIAGTYAGATRTGKSRVALFVLGIGILNALCLGYQNCLDTVNSPFRPTYSLFGTLTHNIGLFGYKNFAAHVFTISGFFLCAYSLNNLKRSWGYLLAGLVLLAISFTCGSRAAYPNAVIGGVLCLFMITISAFHHVKRFYIIGILFVLALIVGAAYILSDLAQGAHRLQDMLEMFTFGTRLDLSKLAWTLADQEPWFGHGSRMYTNLAVETYVSANLPNFAHHEYAQTACDYGYIGLIVQLGLLGLFLVCGVKSVIRSVQLPPEQRNPLSSSALCVLSIAAFHAYGEFIWHNPAILGACAFCGGILCTSSLKQVKTLGNIARVTQGILCGLLLFLSVAFMIKAYPMWILSWQAKSMLQDNRLPVLEKAATYSADYQLVEHNVLHIAHYVRPVSQELLQELERQIEQAQQYTPENHGLIATKGTLYVLQGRYAEAERLLRPYAEYPNRFADNLYGWATIYFNMLDLWANQVGRQHPEQAMGMWMRAYRMMKERGQMWRYYGVGEPAVRKRHWERIKELERKIQILREHNIYPDYSWYQ